MEINGIVEEAYVVADSFGLEFVEVDRTDNAVSLKPVIDAEIFVQIYGNSVKDKLNLTLVFKQRRLYGYDSEGGRYHCRPFENPDGHTFAVGRKSIREFVEESTKLLDGKGLL
ncbi:MAG: hypothetical protein HY884_09845 [Deltaproteobacteria bacterium]|nr:hypothetical protein [Deltaproteobacteria bacterium]